MLDFHDNEYQKIIITDENLIQNFLNTMWSHWEEDILKFDLLSKDLTIENIEKIIIWAYIIDEELCYHFVMKNNKRRKYDVPYDMMKQWLISNHLAII